MAAFNLFNGLDGDGQPQTIRVHFNGSECRKVA